MKAFLQPWAARLNAISLRERLLILITAIVVISLPLLLYVIEPNYKAQAALTQQASQLEHTNQQIAAQVKAIKANPNRDPNDTLESQIEQRKRQIFSINGTLKKSAAELVSPHTMLNMLSQALAEYPGVKLVSATKAEPARLALNGQTQSLSLAEIQPANTIKANPGGSDLSQRYGLYQHSLTLVVEGDFFNVLAYLQALEQLPQRFFWDALDYKVTEHPNAEITITIHTLSAERGWLGV